MQAHARRRSGPATRAVRAKRESAQAEKWAARERVRRKAAARAIDRKPPGREADI